MYRSQNLDWIKTLTFRCHPHRLLASIQLHERYEQTQELILGSARHAALALAEKLRDKHEIQKRGATLYFHLTQRSTMQSVLDDETTERPAFRCIVSRQIDDPLI